MAMGDVIARLSVVLGMDTAAFEEGATTAEKRLAQSAKKIEAFGKRMSGFGQSLSIGLTAPLAALGVKAVQGFVAQERAVADVEAALASMGGASGKTAAELTKTADALEMRSLFDADVILKQVTANLLTFGNVAGKEFDRAQQAAVDMAARLGGEPQAAAIMLGKALNDPVKGIVALTRVGVQFTDGQKKQIEAMSKLGDVAGAQGVILAEVERQFAGAAQAAADVTPWRQAQVAIGQAMDAIGAAVLPVIGPVTDAIVRVTEAFTSLSPEVQQFVVVAGVLGAALGPVLFVFGNIVTVLSPLIAGLKFVGAAALSTGSLVGGLTVALAGLRAMAISLVAAFGPYIAVLAAVAGIYFLVKSRSDEVTTATEKYRKAQEAANAKSKEAEGLLARMAAATGKLRVEIIAKAKADRQAAIQAREKAKADLLALQAETARLKAFRAAGKRSIGATDPRFASLMPSAGAGKAVNQNLRNEEALTKTIAAQDKTIASLTSAISASAAPPPVADIKPEKAASASRGRAAVGPTGPTRAEIEARFVDAQNQLEVEALQAKERLVTNATDRADIQYDLLDRERESRLAQIAVDEDFTAEQKAALVRQVEALYGVAAQVDAQGNIIATANRGLIAQQVERDRLLEMERDAMDTARDEYDIRRDQLAVSHDLADTQADRKRIALEILDLEQQYRRSQLEMVAASQTASDAEKERARRILASLDVQDTLDRQAVARANETDVEKWVRDADKNPAQFAEARTGIALDGIDGLIDGLAQIPGKVDSVNDAFKAMRNVFQSVIQDMIAQLIRLQLQKAIAGIISSIAGAPSAGGFWGSGGGMAAAGFPGVTLPGFATGTNFAPGGLALVGERGPELVNLPRGSQVIPNNELGGMRGNSNITVNVHGAINERQARETGGIIARRLRGQLNGSVR